MTKPKWTNSSVLQLADGGDPIEAITRRAREVVTKAMDEGWSGPPFESLELADILGIPVVPRDDVRDARTVPHGDKPLIQFNPNRPRGRMRYSIAHEIAHTLFADCTERIRHRASYHELEGDEWQLEALCNIAAAEFVMPLGSLGSVPTEPADLTIDAVLALRKEFDVSVESLLIRLVRLTQAPVAMFCASRLEKEPNVGRYRLDYVIGSQTFAATTTRGALLPPSTLLAECTAIGYTAKGDETWTLPAGVLHLEAVGIPPYPGAAYPRVVGILSFRDEAQRKAPLVTYLKGDATEPRGTGKRIIVHVVNDATPNWGGRGFVNGILRKWPQAQDAYRAWAGKAGNLRLGETHFTEVGDGIAIASMVAQSGFGASTRPRIRYAALESCLQAVSHRAADARGSVHMPRIGCGQAGGKWEIIEGLLVEIFGETGVTVTVYDLPDRKRKPDPQGSLLPAAR